MTVSLFTSTLLTALFLLLLGGLFFMDLPRWRDLCVTFLRSQKAAIVTCGLGGGWFLYKILHLSQADFGDYSNILFAVFGLTLVGSFFYVKDFLAVRGAAILALMISHEWLRSAYALYEIPQRLLLVSFVYVVIVLALYLGTVPFRLRDFFTWLHAGSGRSKALGGALAAYGLILLVVGFTY